MQAKIENVAIFSIVPWMQAAVLTNIIINGLGEGGQLMPETNIR